MEYAKQIDATATDTYRYLNFHKMDQYIKKAVILLGKNVGWITKKPELKKKVNVR